MSAWITSDGHRSRSCWSAPIVPAWWTSCALMIAPVDTTAAPYCTLVAPTAPRGPDGTPWGYLALADRGMRVPRHVNVAFLTIGW